MDGGVGRPWLSTFALAGDLAVAELKDMIGRFVLRILGIPKASLEQEYPLGQGAMEVVRGLLRIGVVVGEDDVQGMPRESDGNVVIPVDPSQARGREGNQGNRCREVRPNAPQRQSLAEGGG